ncbi:uncharacterized protein LOC143046948 [Mytilus galloprovincialis]|uniref:uncharacterized protein LOC143046948 n=1 Tax=Mytilus galloprovincialis TaxID=29158 RepID=UPI003F7C0123
MANMYTLALLILALVSVFFQFSNCAGIPLGESCSTNKSCNDNNTNSECFGSKCICKSSFYLKDNDCVSKIDLGTACKDKTQCKDGNAICNVSCTCSEAFYRVTTTCNARISPGKACGNITPKNDSCVVNAYCNKTNFCECRSGNNGPNSCNSAMTLAVVEISTIILCFMMAYFEVLK